MPTAGGTCLSPGNASPIACAIGALRVVQARSVGADIDRAQPQSLAGLNHALLQAVVGHSVDVQARAAVDAETPAAVTPTPAAMEAMRGSGNGSEGSSAVTLRIAGGESFPR